MMCSRCCQRAGRRAGFSLVETLLGVLIFSIVASGLGGVLLGALDLNRQVRSLHERYQSVRLALDLMTRDLENALPYEFSFSPESKTPFWGLGDQMVFFIPSEEGIQEVRYSQGPWDLGQVKKTLIRHVKDVRDIFDETKDAEEIRYLLRTRVPLVDKLRDPEETGRTQVLVSGLKEEGLRLRYGRIDRSGASPRVTFQEEWREKGFPSVVRVEFSSSDQKAGAPVVMAQDIYLMDKEPAL
ncbi:MAG: type II secretion system protein [Elusimicrobia bacterium]|nr:type II secretion system protein [Elusimicrobiota bacterium]